MTLLMNKFSSVVINDWNLDEIHVNYRYRVWYILHSDIHVMKKHFVRDKNRNIVNM